MKKEKASHTWKVYEDDNFHPYDEDERIFIGEYDTHKKVERACKNQ
jgi:hypothetical protein